jgi:hypothetical protein
MAISAANKKKWHQLVERLQQQINLTDEEVITIKEWGVALLVTGVSVWILYRIVRKIFGPSKKVIVEKVVRKDDQPAHDRAAHGNPNKQPNKKRKSGKPSSYGSPWFPLVRRYAGPLLLALVQRQVNSYLRANNIIR